LLLNKENTEAGATLHDSIFLATGPTGLRGLFVHETILQADAVLATVPDAFTFGAHSPSRTTQTIESAESDLYAGLEKKLTAIGEVREVGRGKRATCDVY
jgi:hypothetical protein